MVLSTTPVKAWVSIVCRRRPRHPRVSRRLAGALEAMDECGQPGRGALRGMEPLGEALDFVFEAGDPLLLFVRRAR